MVNNSIEVQADILLNVDAIEERKREYPILTKDQIRYRARREPVVDPTLISELGQSDRFRDYGRKVKIERLQ